MLNVDLTGKIALVTGATGQLGRVMAKTLAECGADVVIHYLKSDVKARELEAVVTAMGRSSLIVQGDITDAVSTLALSRAIFDRFGRVDIVVANAVSQIEWKSVLEQAPEDYVNQYDACVLQSVHLAKAFVPGMMENGWGRFIGINSECAMLLDPQASAYSIAKRAMDGLYRTLAKEIGEHQITVNQVAPGWTISDRDRENHTEQQETYERRVPLKRRGTDQEIANVVAFLASDLASFITGAYIPVAGGAVMPSI